MGVGLNKIEQGMNVIPEANTISGIPTNATIGDLKVSEDGQVMILGLDQGGVRSWISQDGGVNWTDLHSNGELSGTGISEENMQFLRIRMTQIITLSMLYLHPLLVHLAEFTDLLIMELHGIK